MDALGKILLSNLWQENVVVPLKGNRTESFTYTSRDKRALAEAREILIANYTSPPTIKELAKMVGINEFKLKNGFRELFGTSVYEYVRQMRMENARHLLENHDLTISQIANMVGYINTSHFARAFRQLDEGQYRFNMLSLVS